VYTGESRLRKLVEGRTIFMQLYYIRHAQSQNNAIWDRHGHDEGRVQDPDLTDVGVRQAQHVADFLSCKNTGFQKDWDPQNRGGFGITHLYSSLMIRSVKTGTAISKKLGLPLHGWKELHETGGIFLRGEESGEWEGQPGNPRSYFEQHFPDFVLPESVNEDGWWNRPFELHEEHLPRAKSVVETLLKKHGDTDDRVAIVSHGGFYNVLLAVLLGLEGKRKLWFSLNNTGVTRIDFRSDEISILYMNRLDFLPNELIT
jgi:2,3-bisphosphoglycerate-dependent phosphoglycerate mutase